jgi:hypothetical protein
MKPPYERLHGHTPDYTSLRTFGCACWPNLRPYNTKKVQFCSKRCVFLGYNNSHKGFKCLDPSEGRIYISRDIVFDENVFPFSDLHPSAGARLRAEVLLLPDSLQNPTSFGDANLCDQHSPNSNTNCAPRSAGRRIDAGTNPTSFGEETTKTGHGEETTKNGRDFMHAFMRPFGRGSSSTEHESVSPALQPPDASESGSAPQNSPVASGGENQPHADTFTTTTTSAADAANPTALTTAAAGEIFPSGSSTAADPVALLHSVQLHISSEV